MGVGSSLPASSFPRGGGVTPTNVPQNDPHDALIILDTHEFGENFSKKICPSAQASISHSATRRSGRVKIFFCVFHPLLNSPQVLSILSIYTKGKTNNFPLVRPPKIFPAPSVPTVSPKIGTEARFPNNHHPPPSDGAWANTPPPAPQSTFPFAKWSAVGGWRLAVGQVAVLGGCPEGLSLTKQNWGSALPAPPPPHRLHHSTTTQPPSSQ